MSKGYKRKTKTDEELKKKRMANLKNFPKGTSGNPKGKPKGQRDYATIYKEAIIELAKQQGTTPEKLENALLKVGFTRAIKGDFKFYQDTMDRVHGKAVQRNALTDSNGKDLLPTEEEKENADKLINQFLGKLK